MIAISRTDYKLYGCPNCGCDSARCGSISIGTITHQAICRECTCSFLVLVDGIKRSTIGFSTDQKDENNNIIFEYPEVQEHPRKGISCHKWIQPDPRPEYGEYWKARGIGYDLSGFVKSKQAGERLLDMVKEVLGKEKPDSWLDWRVFEPEWIQFKFQNNEFDLEKLRNMSIKNNGILTKEILIECCLVSKKFQDLPMDIKSVKYLVYEEDQIKNEMIYCDKNGDETAEDVVKAITTHFFIGKFIAREHTSITSPIINDKSMFILVDELGHVNIWQVCENINDYTGAIIPHLYKVRKIGFMFE